MDAIKVKMTKKYGRGCYATKNIKDKSLIMSSEVIIFNHKDSEILNQTKLAHYVYDHEDGACLALGVGSLFNHSSKPNVEALFDSKTNTLKFYALRQIKKDEQLFINYGYEIN